MRAGWPGSTITATRRGAVADERRAVQDDPGAGVAEHARERDLARARRGPSAERSAWPATATTAAAAGRVRRRRAGRPASARCRASPTRSRAASCEDEQAGRVGRVRVACLADQQGAPYALGDRRRDRAQEALLVGVEMLLARARGRDRGSPTSRRRACVARAAAPGRRPSSCWPASAGSRGSPPVASWIVEIPACERATTPCRGRPRAGTRRAAPPRAARSTSPG